MCQGIEKKRSLKDRCSYFGQDNIREVKVATIDGVIEYIREDLDGVEETLHSSLAHEIEVIRAVGRYILDSGGKRFRPLLLLLAARLCNYKGDQHIPLACILEYIHTATLLHDDVIDHAQIRRGNSSVNVLWGDQTTVLVGDFLLSKAFSMAVALGDLRILEVISKATTLMAEAETLQVERCGDTSISEEELFLIITRKTASLIAAACQIGGILGGVTSREEKILGDFGLNLGIAFQIMDDVLDYYSNENEFGKTIGKDLQEGSITLPFIKALERSSSEDRKFMIEITQKKCLEKQELKCIMDLIEKYQGDKYAVQKARYYIKQAVDCLEAFEDKLNRKWPLLTLAEYVVERKA
jgi:octaprenyl-diphosphate synthase